MFDENVFGLLVSYIDIENDEYSLEPEAFAKRCLAFTTTLREFASEAPLGEGVTAIDFGHALYLELCEDEQTTSPITWLKQARARLLEALDLPTAAILSHGGRWVDSSQSLPEVDHSGRFPVVKVAHSSEALRRALYAETACHGSEPPESPGWGAGLYLDTEAVEALSLTLKNAPTPLEAAGATFYRAGS